MSRLRGRLRHRVADPPPLTGETEARIWAEIQRRIDTGEADEISLDSTPDRRPLAVSLALATCALVVAFLLVGRQAGTPDELSTAAPSGITLTDLAREARGRQALDLGPGQVLRLVVDHLPTAHEAAEGVVGKREVNTVAGDGRGRTKTTPLPGSTGSPPETTDDLDRPRALSIGGFTPDEIAGLPGTPDALRAAWSRSTGDRAGDLVADQILQLLATPLVPGPARAALFHLLDEMGAEVEGDTTDAIGRPGVTVTARLSGDERVEAVVDPVTTAVLSLRRTGPDGNRFDPSLAVYRAATVVEAAP